MSKRHVGAVALVGLLMLGACTAPDRGDVRLIGHGGCGPDHVLPMNSRAAVMAALERGMDGVEIDVQLTADGVLVAHHDERLDGTGCTGRVHEHPWAHLSACTQLARGGANHPIARVDSLLQAATAAHPGATFTLDCKLFAAGDWWTYLEQFSDALAQLAREEGLTGRLQVECRVDDLLHLVQRKAPNVAVFRYADDPEEAMRHARSAGYTGITVHHGRISREQVARAREAGLQVTLFGTGHSWQEWRALRKQPDQLQTDRVPAP